MEETLNIDELREEFKILKGRLGDRVWKSRVREADHHFVTGQGLLDMNAVRDGQANYVRTLRLVRAMRTALDDTKKTTVLRKQGLSRSTAGKSLEERYPKAHKAQEDTRNRIAKLSKRTKKN